MQLFPPGILYDFMGWRKVCILISVAYCVGSLVLLLGYPGPRLGTDFKGGTEVEVAFLQATDPGEVREAVKRAGFAGSDVIKVEDAAHPNRYLVRVQEVSAIGEAKQAEIERALCFGANLPAAECPQERQATEVKISPGGDKISVRFRSAPDLKAIKARVGAVSGIALREGKNNPSLQNPRDHKVEVQLKSKGDQLMDGLRTALGPQRVPDSALRVEWIGPKAGKQLRDSAVISLTLALVMIMVYVAFRFDLRFAPGGIVALIHDTISTTGVLILTNREINLGTVAVMLTIVGYSINDTVVVYDRVRENLPKFRGATFHHIVNVSISEMLGRTLITNGTVMMSLAAFLIWGTGALKDFAYALIIGGVLGTYSSIYIAAPVTELLDRKFFSKPGREKRQIVVRAKPGEAVV
jgi:preprotein translocase subunit SecF